MSERMGFTSNYFYDIEDYKKLRKKFEEYGNSKGCVLHLKRNGEKMK